MSCGAGTNSVRVASPGQANRPVLTIPISAANLVLQDTTERIYAGKQYADISRGIFLVRGENVLLLGEVVRALEMRLVCQLRQLMKMQDLDREDEIPTTVTKAPFEEVFAMKKQEDARRKISEKKRFTELQALGFEPEHSGEILF